MKLSTPSNPLACLHRVLLVAGVVMAMAAPAHAKDPKLSDDLANITAASAGSVKNTWLNTAGAITYAKVVIVASSSDPDLTDLRRAVVAAGGSVYYRYLSISGLLAVVPLNQISSLTQRADVTSISADRVTTKTFDLSSLLPSGSSSASSAGASTVNTASLDGSGVGIAFLDSGVMRKHVAYLDALASRA